jgi:cation:H+ antiporter
LALIVVLAASTVMERIAATLGTRFAIPEIITGGLVLAAVTSLPNAVAAVFLARRGQAAATLSEALNSNTLNVLAGLLIPAVIVQHVCPADGRLVQRSQPGHDRAGRGVSRRSGFLIIYAYAVFVVTVVVTALR